MNRQREKNENIKHLMESLPPNKQEKNTRQLSKRNLQDLFTFCKSIHFSNVVAAVDAVCFYALDLSTSLFCVTSLVSVGFWLCCCCCLQLFIFFIFICIVNVRIAGDSSESENDLLYRICSDLT